MDLPTASTTQVDPVLRLRGLTHTQYKSFHLLKVYGPSSLYTLDENKIYLLYSQL
jgi:hypothetical protein